MQLEIGKCCIKLLDRRIRDALCYWSEICPGLYAFALYIALTVLGFVLGKPAKHTAYKRELWRVL